MAHIRQELDPSVATYFKKVQPRDKYLGRWDYPHQFFPVQDYVFGLGANPEDLDINLVPALQGVEYLLFIANGITPLTKENVLSAMSYTDLRNFENGALRQFPNFWDIVKNALLTLQYGQNVLDIVHSLDQYTDLA